MKLSIKSISIFRNLSVALFCVIMTIGIVSCKLNPDEDSVYFTVSFETNGGTVVPLQRILKGCKATRPVDPVKEDSENESFIFKDWYTSLDGGITLSEEPFDFDTEIIKNIKLYAVWNSDSEFLPMINGSGNYYYTEYMNESSTENRRAVMTSSLKHAGCLVKITFDKDSIACGTNSVAGNMGLLFDFNKGTFFIICIRSDGKFYVSKYENVTNFDADNFGTSLSRNPAIETQIVPTNGTWSNLSGSMPKDSKGNSFCYVYTLCKDDGTIDWAVLNNSGTDKETSLSITIRFRINLLYMQCAILFQL